VSTEVFRGTGILFFGFVVLQLLLFIIRAPRVDSEVLCAGITIYLMLGLFWSLAYSLIDRLAPDSFVFNAGPRFRPFDARLPSSLLQFHHAGAPSATGTLFLFQN